MAPWLSNQPTWLLPLLLLATAAVAAATAAAAAATAAADPSNHSRAYIVLIIHYDIGTGLQRRTTT